MNNPKEEHFNPKVTSSLYNAACMVIEDLCEVHFFFNNTDKNPRSYMALARKSNIPEGLKSGALAIFCPNPNAETTLSRTSYLVTVDKVCDDVLFSPGSSFLPGIITHIIDPQPEAELILGAIWEVYSQLKEHERKQTRFQVLNALGVTEDSLKLPNLK